MYANSAKSARIDKPCDGVRYAQFNQNQGLERHHIDLDIRPYEKKDELDIKNKDLKKDEQKVHKKGGGQPCGGKFYHVYNETIKHVTWNNPLQNHHNHDIQDHSTAKNNLEAKVRQYNDEYENMQTQSQMTQSHIYTQHDIASVDLAIYSMLQTEHYVKPAQPIEHAGKMIYQKVRSELDERKYSLADQVAEQVEERYSKKYERTEIDQYKGTDRKYEVRKKIEPKKESGSDNQEAKSKKLDKPKIKKQKNELDRHSLPSGLRPVQGSGQSDRKSKKIKSRDNSAKRSESKKQQKVTGTGKKISRS